MLSCRSTRARNHATRPVPNVSGSVPSDRWRWCAGIVRPNAGTPAWSAIPFSSTCRGLSSLVPRLAARRPLRYMSAYVVPTGKYGETSSRSSHPPRTEPSMTAPVR